MTGVLPGLSSLTSTEDEDQVQLLSFDFNSLGKKNIYVQTVCKKTNASI